MESDALVNMRGDLCMSKDCVICGSKITPHMTDEGVVYWEGGHNAEPYASGRCCDLCHGEFVLPARLKQMKEERYGEKWKPIEFKTT